MRLDDLHGKNQPDPCAAWFGRIKRDEQVCRIGDAGTIVLHFNNGRTWFAMKRHAYFWRPLGCGLHGGIRSVPNQIDQRLFQLGGVRKDGDGCLASQRHWDAYLQVADALEQPMQIDLREGRRGQFGQLAIPLQEAIE